MPEPEQLPDITITHEDLAVLSDVVREALAEGRYVAASRLGNELHRARVVPAFQAPKGCLTLNRVGKYMEELSGAIWEVVLVARKGSRLSGTVAVLSGLGTALLGLSEGHRMSWFDHNGKSRTVRLLNVSHTRKI